jgi:hypothetical protein
LEFVQNNEVSLGPCVEVVVNFEGYGYVYDQDFDCCSCSVSPAFASLGF